MDTKQKRRISASELVSDVRSGMRDAELQSKYHLTPEGLRYALKRLVNETLITPFELYERTSLSDSDLMRAYTPPPDGVLTCPECGKALVEDGACEFCRTIERTIEFELGHTFTLVTNGILGPFEHVTEETTERATVSPFEVFPDRIHHTNEPPPVPKEHSGAPEAHPDHSGGTKRYEHEYSVHPTEWLASDPVVNVHTPSTVVEVLTDTAEGIDSAEAARRKVLLKAASRGRLKQVEQLLDDGVEVDCRSEYGNTPLIRAAFKGQLEVLRLLLYRGADPNAENSQGNTALLFACSTSQSEVVDVLLRHGADPNTSNLDGIAPLMSACNEDNPDIVRLLLKAGANVDAAKEDGETPLMWACRKNCAESVKLLIGAGAKLNHTDGVRSTALIKACTAGHVKVVDILLKRGAYVNHRDAQGQTALMKAASAGHVEIVKRLMSAGADVNIADRNGHTVFGHLQEAAADELRDILSGD